MLIVRELTGGHLLRRADRRPTGEPGERPALDTLPYTEHEIRRIVRLAFELARTRRGARRRGRQGERARDVAPVADGRRRGRAEFPDVELEHQLVDSCAMLLDPPAGRLRRDRHREPVRRHPVRRGSVLAGSLGMLPSASLGERRTAHGTFGLYEPIHGSAPDIAGQDMANPIGTILSAAMLLRWSLGREDAAAAIEAAVGARPRRRLADRPTSPTPADQRRRARGRRHDRVRDGRRRARSSAGAWSAGVSDRRRPGRPLRHDPARRHAGREHHALARRQAAHRADARRVRHAVHRGRLARLQPEGHRVLRGRPDDALGAREARRVRLDPPPLEQAGRRPEPARAGRRRDAGRDDLRQDLAAPRHRGPRRDARREPRHDRGLGRLRRRPRPRGGLRRRALLRRLQGRPRLRARDAAGGPPGRRADPRPVRHERRHADRRAGRGSSATSAPRSRPTPTRRR